MEKFFYVCILYIFSLQFLTSCNGCSGNISSEDSVKVVEIEDIPDIVECVGVIGDGSSMNVLELVTDKNDTVYVNTSSDMVMGGVIPGDHVSVIYYAKEDENLAHVAINLSALQHLWSQKGSDGVSQSLELDADGRAVTYNMSVEYDGWSLKDGHLLLHSPKKVATEKGDIVDTFQIMDLSEQRLVLMSHNIETVFDMDN